MNLRVERIFHDRSNFPGLRMPLRPASFRPASDQSHFCIRAVELSCVRFSHKPGGAGAREIFLPFRRARQAVIGGAFSFAL